MYKCVYFLESNSELLCNYCYYYFKYFQNVIYYFSFFQRTKSSITTKPCQQAPGGVSRCQRETCVETPSGAAETPPTAFIQSCGFLHLLKPCCFSVRPESCRQVQKSHDWDGLAGKKRGRPRKPRRSFLSKTPLRFGVRKFYGRKSENGGLEGPFQVSPTALTPTLR